MYYRHEIQEEVGKLLDVNSMYDIFVAKNLNNELKEIIIRPIKR
jgi:hypothetical protein